MQNVFMYIWNRLGQVLQSQVNQHHDKDIMQNVFMYIWNRLVFCDEQISMVI